MEKKMQKNKKHNLKDDLKITDNFLGKSAFHQMQAFFLGHNLPWYFNEHKVYKTNKDLHNFQFVHQFYRAPKGVCSPHYTQLVPLFKQINPAVLIRIKANATGYNPKILEFDLHNDSDYKCTTAIFFMNSNNGYTVFKDGTKIESVANRLIEFPSHYLHAGTTCSDDKVRCVLNLNYIKKDDIKYDEAI
tara:strand:+ start:1105 stop:1671 length:567 start_codon:yes stop_codon:yes gene_type:complete